MRFSATRMKAFMECPLQAHFKYTEKLPELQNAAASFGKIIHASLQMYNEVDDINIAIQKFIDWWDAPELLGCAPDVWPRGWEFGAIQKLGVEILAGYHESLKWEDRTVIATEHAFLVPFGEHELTGFVDLVELRKSGKGKNTIKIVDYKTNKRQPFQSELSLDVQFTTYVYAALQPEFWMGNGPDFPGIPDGERLWEEFADFPRRGIWHHLRTNREVDAGKRTDTHYQQLYRLCSQIMKAVEFGVYIPRMGEPCNYCSYQKECGVEIPTGQEVREEDDAWI